MADNVWGAAAPTSGNSWGTAAQTTPQNPWEGATHAVGGFLDRMGMPKVMDIVDRPRQTVQAAIAGDDPLRTFMHHAGADQQDRDRAAVRKKLGLPGDAERAQARGFRGGLDDFAVDTVTDPMSLLGASAIKYGGKALGAGGKLVGEVAKKVAPELSKDVTKIAHGLGDFFTYGGSAKRDLGESKYNRALAAENRQGAKEEEAARRLQERFDQHIAPLAHEDKRTVYQILNGERQMTDPVSGRLIVAPHVAAAVDEGQKLRNDMAALQGDETARRKLAYGGGKLAANMKTPERIAPPPAGNIDELIAGSAKDRGDYLSNLAGELLQDGGVPIKKEPGARKLLGRVDRQYELPESLKDFAAPKHQGILGAGNVRANYLPGPRAAAEVAKDKPAGEYNLLRPFAPNAIRRDAFEVGEKPEEIAALDEAFRGAIRNAARQGTAGRLRDELGVPLKTKGQSSDLSAIEELFNRTTRATGDERNWREVGADRWKQVVNIPKNTVTTLGMKHGLVNVPDLAQKSEGIGAAGEALGRGQQLARMGPRERYDSLRDAIEGGVVTPFEDRKNPIADSLAKLPVIGGPVGAATKGLNKLTWAIDDAAKQAVLKRKIARGMDPDAAAAETMREMVDYGHRSKATEALSNIAPFATFRSRIPAAIGSSLKRNPQRFLATDRATQGLSTNGEVQIGTNPDGNPKKLAISTPTSDVLGGIDQPQKYARAMTADPLKALLTGIFHAGAPQQKYDPFTRDFKSKTMEDYFTYGQPLLPHRDQDGRMRSGFLAGQTAGYLPLNLGQDALGALGVGEYKPEDLLSALLGGTLGAHLR